jgi:hypothetical protein
MYLDILQQHLSETVDNMPHPPHKVVFQHDNDPKHTAKIVQLWLADQKFQVLEWPAQSSDQNLVENLWFHLKQALLYDYSSSPSNVERVQEQWEKLSPDYCTTLVQSMPRRLAERVLDQVLNRDAKVSHEFFRVLFLFVVLPPLKVCCNRSFSFYFSSVFFFSPLRYTFSQSCTPHMDWFSFAPYEYCIFFLVYTCFIHCAIV